MSSDPGSVRRWLDDIHYHIVLAEKFAEGISYEAFRDDLYHHTSGDFPHLIAAK